MFASTVQYTTNYVYVSEEMLDRVAFVRPGDNATVVVLQNRDPDVVIKVTLKDVAGKRQLNLDLSPKSFTSVLFW